MKRDRIARAWVDWFNHCRALRSTAVTSRRQSELDDGDRLIQRVGAGIPRHPTTGRDAAGRNAAVAYCLADAGRIRSTWSASTQSHSMTSGPGRIGPTMGVAPNTRASRWYCGCRCRPAR